MLLLFHPPALKALIFVRSSGGGRRVSFKFELVRGPDGLERGVDDERDKTAPETGSLAGKVKVAGSGFRLLCRG